MIYCTTLDCFDILMNHHEHPGQVCFIHALVKRITFVLILVFYSFYIPILTPICVSIFCWCLEPPDTSTHYPFSFGHLL